jgi:ATP-dependent protease ClpP protease subunit
MKRRRRATIEKQGMMNMDYFAKLPQVSVGRPSYIRSFRGTDIKAAREVRKPEISAKASENEGEVSELFILDEIGGWGVYAAEAIYWLKQFDGEGKKVKIYINSPGGDVFEGIAIANFIAGMKAETEVVVTSLAASIASIIAIAADSVKMNKNAQMMIHRPWAFTWGESDALRKAADHLDKIEDQLVGTYADRGNGKKKREEYSAAVRAETWMTPEEAIEMGLADGLVGEEIEVKASLKIDAEFLNEAGIKNAPSDLVEPAQEKESEQEKEEVKAQEVVGVSLAKPEDSEKDQKNSVAHANKDEDAGNNKTYTETEVSEIKAICAKAKMQNADELMKNGKTVAEIKNLAFDILAAQDAEENISSAIEGSEGTEQPAAPSAAQINAEIRARQFAEFQPKSK